LFLPLFSATSVACFRPDKPLSSFFSGRCPTPSFTTPTCHFFFHGLKVDHLSFPVSASSTPMPSLLLVVSFQSFFLFCVETDLGFGTHSVDCSTSAAPLSATFLWWFLPFFFLFFPPLLVFRLPVFLFPRLTPFALSALAVATLFLVPPLTDSGFRPPLASVLFFFVAAPAIFFTTPLCDFC